MYYAETILRFFASPQLSSARHPAAESLVQMIDGVIIGVHLPLMLGLSNPRTFVEGRIILQAYFGILEAVVSSVFAWIAWKGEERTGMIPGRLLMAAGGFVFFAAVRAWTSLAKIIWVGAYRENDEKE